MMLEAVAAFVAIGFLGTTGRDRRHQEAARQPGAARAIGPAVLQHQILPFLDDGGRRVPVEGVLQHDEIMIEQPLLLARDVDVEVGILGVEIARW